MSKLVKFHKPFYLLKIKIKIKIRTKNLKYYINIVIFYIKYEMI